MSSSRCSGLNSTWDINVKYGQLHTRCTSRSRDMLEHEDTKCNKINITYQFSEKRKSKRESFKLHLFSNKYWQTSILCPWNHLRESWTPRGKHNLELSLLSYQLDSILTGKVANLSFCHHGIDGNVSIWMQEYWS